MTDSEEKQLVSQLLGKIAKIPTPDVPPEIWLAALAKMLALANLALISGLLSNQEVLDTSEKMSMAFADVAEEHLMGIRRQRLERN